MEENQQQPVGEARERLTTWYPEFFVLYTMSGTWMVSVATARQIESALDRWPRQRWLRFVDITGSRIRVRTEDVKSMQQSTPGIRETWKRFVKERNEEEGDPPVGGFVW